MAIDKILGNGALDQVADSVFSAVSDSVSEIKAMQKRKAAENVQVVIQALKKIESDLQDKYDGVTTVLEKRVASIKDGKDGQNGVDGRAGKDGRPGRDGAVGPRGANGIDGRNGRDGTDGVSVTNANIDFDGSLIISLSNGRTINVGEVVAPDLAERIKVITNGGGTSQGVLDTLTSLQNQINALVSLGAVTYEGTWNASTNTPTIVAGTGNKGEYYVVSVAGNTSIDGETLWGVGDWIIFNGAVWQKVDGGSTGDLTSLTVRDNTTLGSSNTDEVNFIARIASEFTPATNNTYDLGRNSHEWRNLYLSGTANLSGGTANGVAYLNGSKVLTTGSALTFDGTNLGVNCTATNFGTNYRTFEVASPQGAYILASDTSNTATCQIAAEASVGYMGMRTNHPLAFIVNNAEQMRLTSTGLGIGTSSPGNRLTVVSAAAGDAITFSNAAASNKTGYLYTDNQYVGLMTIGGAGNNQGVLFDLNNNRTLIQRIGGTTATFDSSGNLGLGVTPSAWSGTNPVFEFGNTSTGVSASLFQNGVNDTWFSSNAYFNGTNWIYKATGTATQYHQSNQAHEWYKAASGTAGNAITFTQAMTLDASGNLGVGTTSPKMEVQTKASGGIQAANDLELAIRYNMYSSGGDKYIQAANKASSLVMDLNGNFLFYNTNTASTAANSAVTGLAERARITSGGYFKASNAGTYAGSTSAYHELRSNVADYTTLVTNTNATPFGMYVGYDQTPNGTGNLFLLCLDGTATRAEIRSNGGLANYSANDVNLSDRREKTNFAPAKSYLDTICAIPVQTFNYIDQSEDDPGLTLGVVAQDVQAVAPELVMESNWGSKDDPKMRLSIYQTDLQYALMKALQELKAEFDAYKASHP